MLLSGSQLIGTPVMGLQTGKELARTSTAVVNPHNLSVIAYRIEGSHLDHNPSFLRTADIREMGSLGMIVDSSDEFLEPDDIITEKKIYDLEFALEGKHVVDDHKNKVGKVTDYIVDIDSFVIQQLVVKRPLLKSFSDDELLVHRSQIVEVTDDLIIIKSGKVKEKAESKASRHYVNPFRQSSPQPETVRIDSEEK
jgi:uncharacterized protein YrrD